MQWLYTQNYEAFSKSKNRLLATPSINCFWSHFAIGECRQIRKRWFRSWPYPLYLPDWCLSTVSKTKGILDWKKCCAFSGIKQSFIQKALEMLEQSLNGDYVRKNLKKAALGLSGKVVYKRETNIFLGHAVLSKWSGDCPLQAADKLVYDLINCQLMKFSFCRVTVIKRAAGRSQISLIKC